MDIKICKLLLFILLYQKGRQNKEYSCKFQGRIFWGGTGGCAPLQNFLAPPPQEKIKRNWHRYWQLINYYITDKE